MEEGVDFSDLEDLTETEFNDVAKYLFRNLTISAELYT